MGEIASLKSMVATLENRVLELEGKAKKGLSSSMRMVLMGPPGAGMARKPQNFAVKRRLFCAVNAPLTGILGKGTQAPAIKDKYCICHLVSQATQWETFCVHCFSN